MKEKLDWQEKALLPEKVKRAMLDDGKALRCVQYTLAVIRRPSNMAKSRGLVQGDWPGKDFKVPSFDNRQMRFLIPQVADDHCDIKKGRPTYVMVWRVFDLQMVEVTYVGTHERAPY